MPEKKKVASLLDDDDEEPAQQQQPVQPTQPQFTQPAKKQSDPFDILGLDIGGGSTTQQPVANNHNDIFGGISFGQPSQPQPGFVAPPQNKQVNFLDNDFLGTGTSSTQPYVPPAQPQSQTGFGFDFLGGSTTTTATNVQSNNPNNNFGIAPVQQQPQNNNGFKFKAFETEHLEVWMEGRHEADGSTRVVASFNNRTFSYVEQLALQTAVMKYLKIAIQPMSGTSLPPSSKGAVTQVMSVTNSALGQKPIVMKIKLSYALNGQKLAFEEKVEAFPLGF